MHGIVRKCESKKTKKIYAVKTSMIDDEQVLDFQNNFLAVHRLKHPSIIMYKALFYDLKKHNSHLVMEYVNLPSLSEYRFINEG